MLNPNKLLCLLLHALFFGATAFAQCAKFEPPNGSAILILGQDMGSVGGFAAPNNNGYIENVGGPIPGGITTYTDIPYLQGTASTTNYGAGDLCGQCIADNPLYKNSVIAIGLYMVDELGNINSGYRDPAILQLANWVKSINNPVFLRIGYEYDGNWNGYYPSAYIAAFQRIVDKFRANNVTNCAFVWQSTGQSYDSTFLKQWYPGDNYVDWIGYSHFTYTTKGVAEMKIARAHHKPVMIAESTPQYDHINSSYDWNKWFGPIFKHIQDNKDVIKAFAYINANWDAQPLWYGDGWGDTRIENSSNIKTKWLAEINTPFWLKSSPTLFATLNCSSTEIENIPPEISFNAYPNPSNGEINIYLKHPAEVKEINITNLSGQTVFKEFSFSDNTIKISLEDELAAGIYIVSIKNELGSSQQKIVVCK